MDAINPEYYKAAPFMPRSLECIDFARYMCFTLGSAFKYIWRANSKDDYKQELEKAKWYINDYKTHASDCSNDGYLIVAVRELLRPLVDIKTMTRRQIMLGLICLSPYSPRLPALLDECILKGPAYIDEEIRLDDDLLSDLN